MGNARNTPGDGYTMLFVSSSFVVNPSLYAKPPYDSEKDFTPVTKAATSPNGLVRQSGRDPGKTMKELVELIKADPGKYTFASPGIGTTPHLSIELFKHDLKLDFSSCRFRAADRRSSRWSPATRRSASRRSRPRPRWSRPASCARSPSPPRSARPRCPTFRRSTRLGIKGQEAETMQGVLVPAGTPKAIVDHLQARDRPHRRAAGREGASSRRSASNRWECRRAEFAAYIKADIAKWRKDHRAPISRRSKPSMVGAAAKIVICGAGIAGVAAAYHLAVEHGASDT